MTTYSTAVHTEDDDFQRGTPLKRTVHAWDGSRTACGKPGAGMRVGGGSWSTTVADRCPDCAKAT